MAKQSADFPSLVEVEPARPAGDGRPAQSAVYRSAFAKAGFPTLEGIDTLLDLFQ